MPLRRRAGARVITTCGTDEKCARARDPGAHFAINYASQNPVAAVHEITGGDCVDVILDGVGEPTLRANVECLAECGRLVLISAGSSPDLCFTNRDLLRRNAEIHGFWLGQMRPDRMYDLQSRFARAVLPELAAGHLRSVIDCIFRLRDAAEAHRYLEASRQFGKVILVP